MSFPGWNYARTEHVSVLCMFSLTKPTRREQINHLNVPNSNNQQAWLTKGLGTRPREHAEVGVSRIDCRLLLLFSTSSLKVLNSRELEDNRALPALFRMASKFVTWLRPAHQVALAVFFFFQELCSACDESLGPLAVAAVVLHRQVKTRNKKKEAILT